MRPQAFQPDPLPCAGGGDAHGAGVDVESALKTHGGRRGKSVWSLRGAVDRGCEGKGRAWHFVPFTVDSRKGKAEASNIYQRGRKH